MPYMTREEIVRKYGFDPGADENQSVFVKNDELEQDKNLAPSELRLPRVRSDVAGAGLTPPPPSPSTPPTPPETSPTDDPLDKPESREWTEPSHYQHHNAETPTENPLRMAPAGAIRGWIAEPFRLAGLGIAAFNAAAAKAADSDKGFKDEFVKNLYKEGGLEAVQNHLREKQQQLYKEHPDWGSDQIHEELLKYQTSRDFFNFNTDHMATVFGTGMSMAARVNGWFGSPKTPEQETWMDEAAQMVGSAVIPSFGIFSRGLSLATRALRITAPRSVELAARGADILALPGTATQHYTPGVLAGSVGVGLAVNEATRALSGEPTVVGGDAFTPRDPDIGGPIAADDNQGLGARGFEYLAAGGAAVGGAAILGRLLRGKARINPNVVQGGPTLHEYTQAERARTGFEPIREDPTLSQQPVSVEAISRAINELEPAERLARDMARRAEETGVPNVSRQALETDIQAAHGMDLSTGSRNAAITLARDEGVFPNGIRSPVTIKQLQEMAQALPQESVDRLSQGITAMNVADARLRGVVDLMGQYRANPNDPAVLRSLAGRLADTAESRAQFRGWTDNVVGNAVNDMMSDPAAYQLAQHYATANRSINAFEHRAGLTTVEQFQRRQQNPFHVPMFEFQGGNYDPTRPRALFADPANPGAAVNRTLDPFSAINLRLAMVMDEAKINTGRTRAIQAYQAADPTSYFVRRLSAPDAATPEHTLVVREAGREVGYEFSRASVVTALRAEPLTLSPVAARINDVRRFSQWMTTGPLIGGLKAATRGGVYDVAAGYLAARPGRSFGYLTQWARMANNNLFNNSGLGNRIIDTARAFDVSIPVRVAAAPVQMTLWRVADAAGRAMIDSAMTRRGLFGAIAQTPGGRAWLQNAGANVTTTVEQSLYGVMKFAGVLQPHKMMQDAAGIRNRMDKFVNANINAQRGLPREVARNFQTLATPWMAMVDNMYKMGQYAFFSANYRPGMAAHEVVRLAEETRRLAGDIHAHGGSRVYNELMAGTKYGNIGFQSLRYIIHAATTQGPKQSTDLALRLGVITMGAYAGQRYVEALGEAARDWYWNQLPEWQRVGTYPMPSFDNLVEYAKTGQWPAFDPKDPLKSFAVIADTMPRMAAEIVPFYQIGLAVAESLGLTSRGPKNTARGSGWQDVKAALANSIGIGSHMAITVPMVVAGQKTDFLGPLKGRGISTPIQSPRGEDGTTPGGIPSWGAELAKELGGIGMDYLVQITDAGLQSYERGQGFVAALHRAGLEAVQKVKEVYPTVPGLWKGEQKIYTQTAEASAIRAVEKIEQAVEKTWQTEFGKKQMRTPNAGRMQDQDAAMSVAIAHELFQKKNYRQLKEWRSMLEQKREALQSSKAQLSPEQITAQTRKINEDIRGVNSKMTEMIDIYDGILRKRLGRVFERSGLEPKIENVPALIDRYKRKAPQ